MLFPLRHFLYPGVVHWTEEGHRFAWHMKLRQKRGTATFLATDPANGRTWTIDWKRHLTPAQIARLPRRPDMCLQFAHFLARELRETVNREIEIRVECNASLNGRPAQYLIDPKVDLAKQPRSLAHADWIMPLKEPPPE